VCHLVILVQSYFSPDESENRFSEFSEFVKALSWQPLQKNARQGDAYALQTFKSTSTRELCASETLRDLNRPPISGDHSSRDAARPRSAVLLLDAQRLRSSTVEPAPCARQRQWRRAQKRHVKAFCPDHFDEDSQAPK